MPHRRRPLRQIEGGMRSMVCWPGCAPRIAGGAGLGRRTDSMRGARVKRARGDAAGAIHTRNRCIRAQSASGIAQALKTLSATLTEALRRT